MNILNNKIEKFNKGTQYESNVLVVHIENARDNQGQFIDAITLVHRSNPGLNLKYFYAENVKDNVYKLCFSVK